MNNFMTLGPREQEFNVTQSWRGILQSLPKICFIGVKLFGLVTNQ